ncbi:hypothetical protein ES705_38664 [subsurface metagenome]
MALKKELHSRDFYCEKCQVEFRVTIEPNTDILREKFQVEYPGSVKFLRSVEICPVCMRLL